MPERAASATNEVRRGGGFWERLGQDMRYGARLLRTHRTSSGAAILTLGLGIGATTAIFSVVYGVLLRPLPYPRPDRIVQLWEVNERGKPVSFADPNFADVQAQNRSLQAMAQYASSEQSAVIASPPGAPVRTTVAMVSSDFLRVMGVRPVVGRGFAAEEQRSGAAAAALVSYAFWRQHLGGTTDLARCRLVLDRRPTAVAGVLPRGFAFPDEAAIWLPREIYPRYPSRTAHNWRVVARLGDGVALAQARGELSGIARQLKRQYGRDINMTDAAVLPLREALTGEVRGALLILLGAVGFLLLIACANVVNLLLAQLAAREGELALRAALGAGRLRLARQLFTEALLLAASGGVLGVLAASWGVAAVVAAAPSNLPRLGEVAVNLPVLAFSCALSLAVAAFLGVLTARRATSRQLQSALAAGGRGRSGGPGSQRLGRAIVAAQLAMTLVLLVGAGLLGRSLARVLAVEPGFRTEKIVMMNLALPDADSDADGRRRARFLDDLFAGLRNIAGVTEVGGTSALPLTSGLSDGTFLVMSPGQSAPARMEDMEPLFHDAARTGNADFCVASTGYFRALGIPLVRGRLFDDRDTFDAPHAAVVSQALVRERWPGQDPLGRIVEFGNMDGDLRLLTVVGVVGDVRDQSLEAAPKPVIYVEYRQRPRATSSFDVVLRADADAAAVIAEARSIVRRLDPTLPPSFRPFTEVVSRSLAARRFQLILVGLFATSALLLAMIGIYGVMSYAVARRTREVGVRMALGAQAGDVLRLILRQQVAATAAGVAAGIAGAVALTRSLQSLLFEVSATDPMTFVAVALLLAAVALVASYVPARRATEVDPVTALQAD
jgi:putative ABC transport system permease protein